MRIGRIRLTLGSINVDEMVMVMITCVGCLIESCSVDALKTQCAVACILELIKYLHFCVT
jgi:hypothetical protein